MKDVIKSNINIAMIITVFLIFFFFIASSSIFLILRKLTIQTINVMTISNRGASLIIISAGSTEDGTQYIHCTRGWYTQ